MDTAWTASDLYRIADRACSLLEQGRYREAAVLFDGLYALDPGYAYAGNGLAAACLALGRYDEALGILDFLLLTHPEDHLARARRCEALLRLGRLGPAAEDLDWLRGKGGFSGTRRLELMMTAYRRRGQQLPGAANDN